MNNAENLHDIISQAVEDAGIEPESMAFSEIVGNVCDAVLPIISYTGLQDKDGRDIYAGDALSIFGMRGTFLVTLQDGRYGIKSPTGLHFMPAQAWRTKIEV